jgi:hypothetical protein
MATPVTATLDANDEECGPVNIGPRGGILEIRGVSGTITLTLWRSIDGGKNYVTTNESYTSNQSLDIIGEGKFKVIASGVSAGSAVVTIYPR